MNTENNASRFWKELSPDERHKLVLENNFWDGFINYLYEYLPEDLKKIIRLKSS